MACSQPLIIHVDGNATCAVPGCVDLLTVERAVGNHRHVVNCRSTLGGGCARCRAAAAVGPMSGTGPDPARPARPARCPGSVIIHVDLSLECSESACPSGASRPAWLADHAVFLPCGRPGHPDDCPLCALAVPAG